MPAKYYIWFPSKLKDRFFECINDGDIHKGAMTCITLPGHTSAIHRLTDEELAILTLAIPEFDYEKLSD